MLYILLEGINEMGQNNRSSMQFTNNGRFSTMQHPSESANQPHFPNNISSLSKGGMQSRMFQHGMNKTLSGPVFLPGQAQSKNPSNALNHMNNNSNAYHQQNPWSNGSAGSSGMRFNYRHDSDISI